MEQGKIADLVVIRDDPLKEIAALERPLMVIKGGVAVPLGDPRQSHGLSRGDLVFWACPAREAGLNRETPSPAACGSRAPLQVLAERPSGRKSVYRGGSRCRDSTAVGFPLRPLTLWLPLLPCGR